MIVCDAKETFVLTESQSKVVCQNSHGAQMFTFFLLFLLQISLAQCPKSTIGNNTYTETTLSMVISAPDI